MTKNIKYPLIVVIVIFLFGLVKTPISKVLTGRYLQADVPAITPAPQLPSGWVIATDKESQVKIEKTITGDVKQKIRPTVILTSKSIGSTESFIKYTDRLKSGASLTIPSLKYLTDEAKANTRRLTGYYTNSGTKIYLIQRLSIESGVISTITASYLGDITTEAEIAQVFDYLLVTRLSH